MTNKNISIVGTFKIYPTRSGFSVRDTASFNRWAGIKQFVSLEAAEDYAQRAHDFKIGRRMTV